MLVNDHQKSTIFFLRRRFTTGDYIRNFPAVHVIQHFELWRQLTWMSCKIWIKRISIFLKDSLIIFRKLKCIFTGFSNNVNSNTPPPPVRQHVVPFVFTCDKLKMLFRGLGWWIIFAIVLIAGKYIHVFFNV